MDIIHIISMLKYSVLLVVITYLYFSFNLYIYKIKKASFVILYVPKLLSLECALNSLFMGVFTFTFSLPSVGKQHSCLTQQTAKQEAKAFSHSGCFSLQTLKLTLPL